MPFTVQDQTAASPRRRSPSTDHKRGVVAHPGNLRKSGLFDHGRCVLKRTAGGTTDPGEIVCSDGAKRPGLRTLGRHGDEHRRLAKTNSRCHDERTAGPSQGAETKRASSSKNIQPPLRHCSSSDACSIHPRLA